MAEYFGDDDLLAISAISEDVENKMRKIKSVWTKDWLLNEIESS